MEQPASSDASRKLEPHFFGPLTDDPVVDTGTADLFPGEDLLLSRSARKRTRRLLNLLAGPLEIACSDDEHILHVAAAQQVPTFMEWLGVGWWFYSFHRVALVFTNQRLIEIMLDLSGRSPRTRYRTYMWDGTSRIKPGVGKIMLQMEDRTKAAWRVPARADRKIIKLLVPRIEDKALGAVTPREESAHRWLCPQCGASLAPNPETCRECRATFRTPTLATLLALALPGAGLYYVGRPFMATFDLIGELALFAFVAIGLASVETPEDVAGVAVVGLIVLAVTKLESVHLSRIFVRRTLPESARSRGIWKRIAVAGGALSVTAILAAFLSVGSLIPHLMRDLTFVGKEATWVELRGTALGELAEGDVDLRSVWTHLDGFTVYVDAYVMDVDETFSDVHTSWLTSLRADGLEPTVMDRRVPLGIDGVRFHVELTDEDGSMVMSFNYLLYDEESSAVHFVYAYATAQETEAALKLLEDLVSTAAWVPSGG